MRLDLERLRHSLLLADPPEIELTAIPGFVFAADEMLWTLKISGADLWVIFKPK
jgi:hypothetical protein